MNSLLFELLRYGTMVIDMIQSCRRYFYTTGVPQITYYLSFDHTEFNPNDEFVPDGCVYVCEYMDDNKQRKAIVRYEGERITTLMPSGVAFSPWLWIGDTATETELTYAIEKFLVCGNRIRYELLYHLMNFDNSTTIQYIDRQSLDLRDFPEEGIVIRANDSI